MTAGSDVLVAAVKPQTIIKLQTAHTLTAQLLCGSALTCPVLLRSLKIRIHLKLRMVQVRAGGRKSKSSSAVQFMQAGVA